MSQPSVFRRVWPTLLSCFADNLGLGLMIPSLPYHLAQYPDGLTWMGLIVTVQFVGFAFGNLFWGYLSDIKGSKFALFATMFGDVVFFSVSAVPVPPYVLLIIRLLAGFMTPYAVSIAYAMDRLAPEEIVTGITFLTIVSVLAYGTGGILVAALFSRIGWLGLMLLSGGLSLLACVCVLLFTIPSKRTGRLPVPVGIGKAMRTSEMMTVCLIAFGTGWAYNSIFVVQLARWATFFNIPSDISGYIVTGIVGVMLISSIGGGILGSKIGARFVITIGTTLLCLTNIALCFPAVNESMGGFTACIALCWVFFVMRMPGNQSRPAAIAAKHTTNGEGALIGIMAFFMSAGQAVSPTVSMELYLVVVWAPYAFHAGLAFLTLVIWGCLRVPFFYDDDVSQDKNVMNV